MHNCRYCGAENQKDVFCSICGEKLASRSEEANLPTRGIPSYKDFQKVRQDKEAGRRQTFVAKRKKPSRIKINVGVMRRVGHEAKYVRGSLLPVEMFPSSTERDVLEMATKKHKMNDKSLPLDEYVLLYKDGSRAKTLPGTTNIFSVRGYKEFLGKPFNSIQLFICPKDEYDSISTNSSDSDDLPDPHLNTGYQESDTSWETLGTPELLRRKKPRNKTETKKPVCTTSSSSTTTDTESNALKADKLAPYRQYITILSDGSEDEDEERGAQNLSASPSENDAKQHTNISSMPSRETKDILQELAMQIQPNNISRFNINRRNVWDGACRGFRRSTFSPSNTLLVKFTDDSGLSEEAVDQGGPRREFLRLLMDAIQNSSIFEGPPTARILTLDSHAIQRDDYFLTGMMLAVNLVHGGPPPKFFSKLLFDTLVYDAENVKPSIEDIPESEFKQSLTSIMHAESLDKLREAMDRNSSTLTLAGCFHHVKSVEDRHEIVNDMLQWYVLGRTRAVCERLKAGLETLGVLATMQSYPDNFKNCLVFSEEKLTAVLVEDLFKPGLSPGGSNRRVTEERIIGYWMDFLQDAEEGSTVVTLEDVLIFATGTNRIPPLGLLPSPKLSFLHKDEEDGQSKFPIANTCANQLKLPIHPSYDLFKENVEFGILNSPNFGRA